MKTFFDSDNVECVYLDDVLQLYKYLRLEDISNKTWDINGVDVMAYDDMKTFLSDEDQKELDIDLIELDDWGNNPF